MTKFAWEKLKKEIREAKKADPSWLSKSVGERLLKRAYKLTSDYKELTKIFGLSSRRLEYGTRFHGLTRPRQPSSYRWNWPDKIYAIVQEYYEKSQSLISKAGSIALVEEMVFAVNKARRKIGLPPTNVNAIRCIVRDRHSRGDDITAWGWSPGRCSVENRRPIIAAAVRKSANVKNDLEFDELVADLAKRLGVAQKTVYDYVRQLNFRWRYQRKKLVTNDSNIDEDKKWLEAIRG